MVNAFEKMMIEAEMETYDHLLVSDPRLAKALQMSGGSARFVELMRPDARNNLASWYEQYGKNHTPVRDPSRRKKSLVRS